MTTQQSITSGQSRQIVQFASVGIQKALDDVGLDKAGAQRVIERGDIFVTAVCEALKELLVSDMYRNEQLNSDYGYPTGFHVKPFTEQLTLLCKHLGLSTEKIHYHSDLVEKPLPLHAEACFAIPRWQTIAPTYVEALNIALLAIVKQRSFEIQIHRPYGVKNVFQTEHSLGFLAKLEAQQPNANILVVPAQFGKRHRGRSIRRAREVFAVSEFGLGLFAVACMLLTHPERMGMLGSKSALWINCCGDDVDAGSDCKYLPSPQFLPADDKGKIHLDFNWANDFSTFIGAASAFLP